MQPLCRGRGEQHAAGCTLFFKTARFGPCLGLRALIPKNALHGSPCRGAGGPRLCERGLPQGAQRFSFLGTAPRPALLGRTLAAPLSPLTGRAAPAGRRAVEQENAEACRRGKRQRAAPWLMIPHADSIEEGVRPLCPLGKMRPQNPACRLSWGIKKGYDREKGK